jgi:hypothetical protein
MITNQVDLVNFMLSGVVTMDVIWHHRLHSLYISID